MRVAFDADDAEVQAWKADATYRGVAFAEWLRSAARGQLTAPLAVVGARSPTPAYPTVAGDLGARDVTPRPKGASSKETDAAGPRRTVGRR